MTITRTDSLPYVHAFVYLQALDFLTTMIGFRFGAAEASPFVRLMMHFGPAAGVALSKLLAFFLGAACIYMEKQHLLRWISYWYGGLVLWNLCVILRARGF